MKYLVYVISLLFVFAFAQDDNSKNTKVDERQNNEAVAMDKNTCKGHKGYRHNCESKKEECKKSKSCEHKCDKSNKTVKEHKCGAGKCGGDKATQEIKEDKSN